MAFKPENFVICSKFPLFKASSNLWLYVTDDSLETCLGENYFRPRENVKNQDSPKVGDVIQLLTQGYQMSFVRIISKTEKPYNITVARTFLETEANLIAELASKADKTTDFATPITNSNKGITQTEQAQIEALINDAANSGVMITPQGVWYAKMDSNTVAPSADEGATYADFSQLDADNNPIIVTYTYTSGAWVLTDTITPPAASDGYVAVTLKFWDIPQQSGQQGGRVLWNHTAKTFTAYPTIVSYNDVTLTGDSTVVMPDTPTDGQIINLEYFNEHMRGAGRNVGDVFYTARKDITINGAVACDGSTYQTTDYSGSEAPGALLTANKLPYVSLAEYADLLAANGSVGVFGWDGMGTTAFRVPTLSDIFLETGTVAQVGNYLPAGLPSIEHTHGFSVQDANETTGTNGGTGTGISFGEVNKTTTENSSVSEIYGNSDTVQPNAVRFRAMIQLYVGAGDESLVNLSQVAYTGDYNDLSNKPTIPTVNNSTITLTQGGVTKGSFTLNQSGSDTIALDGSDPLPSQTGNSGKFLTTDGTDASWAATPKEIEWATYGTTTYQQVKDWSDAGKEVYLKIVDQTTGVSRLVYYNATKCMFANFNDAGNMVFSWVNSDNTWDGDYRPTQRQLPAGTAGEVLTYTGTAGTVGSATLPDVTTRVAKSGDTMTGNLGFNITDGALGIEFNGSYVDVGTGDTVNVQRKINSFAQTTGIQFIDRKDNTVKMNYQMGANGFCALQGDSLNLGSTTYPWTTIYVGKINNGNDITVPTASGTLALTSDIPTVNNQTITITQGGVLKGSFTLNQASGDTIELDAGGGGTPLPTQTGNSGKFLTTDGSVASWANVPSGPTSTTVTLAVNDWSANSQTVSATGVTANNIVLVAPAPSSNADYVAAGIVCTAQSSGALTFTCSATPVSAITVNVVVFA